MNKKLFFCILVAVVMAFALLFSFNTALGLDWQPNVICSIEGNPYDPGPDPGQGSIVCEEVMM